MSSKSQRRKERHEQKRKEKRNKQAQSQRRPAEILRTVELNVGSNARHRQRLAQQVPRAWPNETPEDVAVFDDIVFATLPPEIAQQVTAVRDALRDATESRGDEAIKRTSVISRSSPLSEWRLFIRGLVDWLAGETEPASESWKRLDPQRRPGRIATTMMVALRTDLEEVSHPTVNPEPAAATSEPANATPTLPWDRWDDQLLYHAKLLRRVRFDRAALRVAEAGVKVPEAPQKLLLGPKKLQWLKQFIKEYRDTEPDLTAALSQTALGRASVQTYSDLFDDAARSFAGPPHDPKNQLLTFHYYRRFEDDFSAETTSKRALEQYLNVDLPQNESLPQPLRKAIASQIHYYEAMNLMNPKGDRGGMMDFFFDAPREDTKGIRTHFKAAVKAAPTNRPAHVAYHEWIDSKLDDEDLTQAKREPLEKELAEVMRSWSKGLPEDVEPRLWLVDYLLENEQMDEAKPHVDLLAACRVDDPRVRATPWKWQLLEAMRLCRRKAWLAEVPARLDEAEAAWPAWLPKQWLPYLRAAYTLRSAQAEAFESQRQQVCQANGVARDSLTDTCMMLGAAQMMRVPAADLKPLRASLDQALKQIKTLPLEELMKVGGFFWDLHRVQLVYPAYRMHGRNIGKEMFARIGQNSNPVLDGVNDELVQKAILWGSEYRFWPSGYDTKQYPFFLNPVVQKQPVFTAARVNAFLKERRHWGYEKYTGLGPLLREAAQSQRDAYYRHWFTKLADELDEITETEKARFGRFPFGNLFGSMGGDDDDDEDGFDLDDDDDDDDDLDFDPGCYCPDCQAARLAYANRQQTNKETPF